MAEFTYSSGNVFEDLGFSNEEAENLKVRSVLMAGIRGKIELFSIDALINMLAAAGHRVEISVAMDGDRAA